MRHTPALPDFLERHKKNVSCRTFVIADAGVHHGCDLETARQLIVAAAHAGADAIKFQTYKADTLVTRWAPTYWQMAEAGGPATQFEYFESRDRFGFDEYRMLRDYAFAHDIVFCSTPFGVEAVDWLERLDVPFWKIASADLDNYPLLEAVARTGRPILLSTGASYFREVRETVHYLESLGVSQLALLHCNLAYPTPVDQANLGRIPALIDAFPGTPIGYSDHTMPAPDVMLPALAVALGACLVEKHFTLDRGLPNEDHAHSVDAALLRAMVTSIAAAEAATSLDLELTPSEWPARTHARRSLVARGAVAAGSVLTADTIAPKRPGGGISPAHYRSVVGRRARVDIPGDSQIGWEMLEDLSPDAGSEGQ